MLCPSCSKPIDKNSNSCPSCAKPLYAKCVLHDVVNKVITWQYDEIPMGQVRCVGFFGSRGSYGGLPPSVGTLVVTNQRILHVGKSGLTGLFSQSYSVNYALNLEDIVSVSQSRLNDQIIILDKANLRSQFSDSGGAFTRKVHLLIPVINSAVSQRKSQIQAIEAKNDSPSQHIVSEDANVKEIIKETRVIVKVRCSYCKNLYEETLDKCPQCGARQT